ncbi:MAG: hypothetical protein KME13_22430 [Myxacorys californica WJT36-NPBG1]|jgi:hypothetical protein|nr:hypothetical protein [Myxacorys californica WJT36-NPBG1]
MTQDSEKLLAELVLSQKDMMREVRLLREQLAGHPGFIEGWADPKTAAQALKNEGVKSHSHLSKLRLSSAFTEGKDIRNVSTGNRPTWEYHIPNCRKALGRYFRNLTSVG